ncbi:MAG: Unknown protein [uncultured Sulfurovum sp.]|uniref:Uncharacterized protein n=1 Tax=uncultured Sulfurovum sp. TaxID=269237 RepID=A0A6S6SX43_9BACT|nr:MAG: Unknown protein [uncultured Sulfurovum sp.]
MKDIIDFLQSNNLVFKSFKPIELKNLGSRKKVSIYLGVDLKKYYACILHIQKKSRILKKEATELMLLHEKLEVFNESKIMKKYIYIQAPLCSKAKALMEEKKWIVWHEEY